MSFNFPRLYCKKISFYTITILTKPNALPLWFIQGDNLLYIYKEMSKIYLSAICHDEEIHGNAVTPHHITTVK